MSTSETINLLSDVLLEDERIVTRDEREFLADLLRRSESSAHDFNPVVTETIAKIAGEIVVERAGTLMADSILRKLTDMPNVSRRDATHTSILPPRPPTPVPPNPGPTPGGYEMRRTHTSMLPPRPPTPVPPNPGPTPGGYEMRRARTAMLPPRPPTPVPPNPGPTPGGVRAYGPKGILNLSIEECTELLPPRCVVLEEFLVPAELNDLLSYTLAHENEFKISEVISPGVEPRGTVDFEYRRSHVLMDVGLYYDRFVDRLQNVLPRFLPKLGLQPFPVSRVEAQITASRDGDYFRWHNDNGQDEVSARKITFVYFFHREPKAFDGGELRIQSAATENPALGSGNYYSIVPRQNQLVLFDSSLTHEIAPVKCPSGKFGDSRFTVNGWVSC